MPLMVSAHVMKAASVDGTRAVVRRCGVAPRRAVDRPGRVGDRVHVPVDADRPAVDDLQRPCGRRARSRVLRSRSTIAASAHASLCAVHAATSSSPTTTSTSRSLHSSSSRRPKDPTRPAPLTLESTSRIAVASRRNRSRASVHDVSDTEAPSHAQQPPAGSQGLLSRPRPPRARWVRAVRWRP